MDVKFVKDMTIDQIVEWLRGPKGKTMSQEAALALAHQMHKMEKPTNAIDKKDKQP